MRPVANFSFVPDNFCSLFSQNIYILLPLIVLPSYSLLILWRWTVFKWVILGKALCYGIFLLLDDFNVHFWPLTFCNIKHSDNNLPLEYLVYSSFMSSFTCLTPYFILLGNFLCGDIRNVPCFPHLRQFCGSSSFVQFYPHNTLQSIYCSAKS